MRSYAVHKVCSKGIKVQNLVFTGQGIYGIMTSIMEIPFGSNDCPLFASQLFQLAEDYIPDIDKAVDFAIKFSSQRKYASFDVEPVAVAAVYRAMIDYNASKNGKWKKFFAAIIKTDCNRFVYNEIRKKRMFNKYVRHVYEVKNDVQYKRSSFRQPNREDVQAEIDKLDDHFLRAVLRMRVVHRIKPAELAKILKIPEPAVDRLLACIRHLAPPEDE